MMNLTDRLQEAISKIFELLNEEYLNQEIDARIDAATGQFQIARVQVDLNASFSHKFFHDTISRFIRHIYEHGLRIPRMLSFPQAHAEAILLLGKYRNAYSIGYDAAILDAANPNHNGIELIVANLAEIIKEAERDKHIQWVLFKYVDSHDWETKTGMVELLLEKFKPFLPPSILECDPAQLADNCHTLIFNQISTDKLLHKITSSKPLF